MVGIAPSMCAYNEIFTVEFNLEADTHLEALANDFAKPCGYHMQYAWGGADDVTFIILTSNAVFYVLNYALLFIAFIYY